MLMKKKFFGIKPSSSLNLNHIVLSIQLLSATSHGYRFMEAITVHKLLLAFQNHHLNERKIH